MPNFRAHLAGGAAVAAGLTYSLPYVMHVPKFEPLDYAVCFGLCLIGSLFPDIDVKSVMQRLATKALLFGVLIALLLSQWELFLVLSCFTFFIYLIRHRTITHKIWFAILFPLPISAYIISLGLRSSNIVLFYYVYFASGIISHIILDRNVSRIKRYLRKKKKR